METAAILHLKEVKQRVEATQADLAGSTFTDVRLTCASFRDVNLSGVTIREATLAGGSVDDANLSELRISNANLTKASIVDCLTAGMTIEGILVSDLLKAYRAAHPQAKQATQSRIPKVD